MDVSTLVGQAEALMVTQGSNLTRLCLGAIAGFLPSNSPSTPPASVPRNSIRSFADLMFTLVDAYPAQFRAWAYPEATFTS